MFNYVVTAQKPTSVSHSIVGNFTSPSDINLILGKSTRIEILSLSPEGLQPILDVGIYGKIASLFLFRFPGEQQDVLFISTERFKFCVVGYDSKNGRFITRAAGDLQDRVAHEAEIGQKFSIDPDGRLIGAHLYKGLLKIIPIEKGQLAKEAYNIGMEEINVFDIKFLYGMSEPTIAVLYEDAKETRHVKTYQITKTKELREGPFAQPNSLGASHLVPIPEPFGGLLIFGERSITYINKGIIKTTPLKGFINAWGKIDKDRYLLGDENGILYLLVLLHDYEKITDLKLENLGEISIPSTISYLDRGVVYIGSTYGDCQLVKLTAEKGEKESYLEELERFTNLGPIVDFCVVDLDRQGQGQLITCSGAFKNGTLRIVRNGIGINEQATVELPGIKGLWSLRASNETEFHKYIVLSFVSETRVLAMANDELSETEIPGFQSNEQTLFCGNVVQNNQIIQITSKGITLLNGNLEVVNKWAPPNNAKINVASCNSTQILLATGGGNLFYLQVEESDIKLISQQKLEYEISCVNINPLGNNQNSKLCAVGMWTDISIRLFEIPSLKMVASQPLGGEVIPRSILLISFEGIDYVLCALGDGNLFTFVLNTASYTLSEKRKLSLGTTPISLSTFYSSGSLNVFASSDRPTVIYSSNKKLLFSNVNLKEVNQMCAFNSESFPESLALATEESLMIGTIDNIQKLHIRTVPLNETPRRIAHQPSSNSLLVVTLNALMNSDSNDVGFCRLIDDQTFEFLDFYQLKSNEHPTSVISTSFRDDSNKYYVVGTAFVLPEESEPTKGRILVFLVSDKKLKLVSEKEVKGAVYSMCNFNESLLVGVNSKVELYSWIRDKDQGYHLNFECRHTANILVLFLASRGDFFVVGDLMKSVSLLLYKTVDNTMELIARDFNSHWMTAVEVLDEDTYIGAENFLNLFTVRRNTEATTDDERLKLEVCGQFHLGEFVNRFRHGSLVMKLAESEDLNVSTLLFGTVSGAIGVIASLPPDFFQFLFNVQEKLTKIISGVGGFDHSEWRSFSNDKRTSPAKNFIDGDLVESFLELKPDKMQEVAKSLDVSVEELTKKIETIQRALH